MGLGSWFVPLGIQMVLFSWLAAIVLHMDAFAVGIAQVALMAPGILFLPLGGLVADRGNPRRLLLRYHLLYAVPPLVLGAVLAMGGLSYPLLIAYGLAAGSIGAFAVPTRDALLPAVAAGQPAARRGARDGAAVRRPADRHRLRLAGRSHRRRCRCCWRMPLSCCWAPSPSGGCPIRRRIRRPQHPSFWRSIGDGIAEAARSEQIWPVLLLNFGIGVFYVGPFMAVLPLVVRDIYHGGAAEIAYVNLAFWAGTIVAAFAFAGLARRLTRRGRLVVCAVSVGAVILFCMALQPPFLVLNALCFVWGLGAGITLTQGRTVLQIVAPPTHRARLMSLFQLGLGGGGPIGAFIAGTSASVLGLQARHGAAGAGDAVLIARCCCSRIWTMRTVERALIPLDRATCPVTRSAHS